MDILVFASGSSPLINFSDCRTYDLYVWDSQNRIFGDCFLRLAFQLPFFGLLAISSAYYAGRRQLNYILFTSWNPYQSAIIYLRSLLISLLALIPLVGIMLNFGLFSHPLGFTEVVLAGLKSSSWLLHLIYTLQLKRGVSYNCRGPKPIICIWVLTFISSVIVFWNSIARSSFGHLQNRHWNSRDFREIKPLTHVHTLNVQFIISGVEAFLQFLYLCTIIPGNFHMDQMQHRSLLTDAPSESHSVVNQDSRSLYIGFHEDDGPLNLGVAKENANCFSKLFFLWVNRLMIKGSCGYLSLTDDLFDLPPKLSTAYVATKFQKCITNSEKALIRSLLSCYGFEFFTIGILKIATDACNFLGPIMLNLLLNYIEGNGEDNYELGIFPTGYKYVLVMLVASLVGSLCSIHFDMWVIEVSLKIRAAIATSIYRKTLLLRKTTLENFSSGEIINYLSIDTDRITNFCPSFHAIWSLPIQIGLALYLLYTQIGLAFLAGLAFAIFLIPINKIVANRIGGLSTKMMSHKDRRVKIISEILTHIRTLKFHVWESFFARRVNDVRKMELNALRGRKYLDALCVYFWATTPVLVSLLSFGTYILLGYQLTAAKVFTSLALFNMLISPLNALPWVINGLVDSWVSLRRVSILLLAEETDPLNVYTQESSTSGLEVPDMLISSATFSSGDNENITAFLLDNVNIEVKPGQLIGIVGEVGAGKSSLLLGMLGELSKLDGNMFTKNVNTGFGVVFQEPWIQRGSIRRNILFGAPYDSDKYNQTINACCLLKDLDELKDGDNSSCSSTTLSGGQKLRITLARAVYQDKPIYLLDDIFSAVDANVGKQLYKTCLMGILRKKTRILVTHQVKYLRSADLIIVVDNGRIINRGTPQEILPVFFDDDGSDVASEIKPNTRRRSISSKSTQSTDSKELYATLTRSTDFINKSENYPAGNSQLDEMQCEGAISFSVYKAYWTAIGHHTSLGIILFLFLMQATKNMSDLWLAHWVSSTSTNNSLPITPIPIEPQESNDVSEISRLVTGSTNTDWNWTVSSGSYSPRTTFITLDTDLKYYFLVFILIGILNSFCTMGRAFLFAYGAIQGGKELHLKLLRRILKAKMKFFDNTPLGRIINRFSSDISTVDDSLPFILNILLAQILGLLGTLFITSYALPWLLVVIIPLLLVVNNIQIYYRSTARQIRRISSISLSPIYDHFSETIRGVVTIRAMRVSRRFEHENEVYLESNQKARYSTQAVAAWLNLRLQLVGATIITSVGTLGVMQHEMGFADPGVIGLAISYALTITNSLGGFVSAFTETEKEMVAVERVHEYINAVEGEGTGRSELTLPYLWPSQGVVTFNNVSLRYRDGNSWALRNINFETGPFEKIGIIGRTGAGKSSLFQALFRIVDNYEGDILVDSVNIRQTGFKDLRCKMWIVPQDPLVFSGTIRENLNPKGDFSDDSIMRVVQKCQLTVLVRQLGGLDGDVGDSGCLLSAGQKQLVQLARAILINPKILCIDEATANIDHETDKIIQATIRTSFRTSTVLTVAHRVSSVLHSHRVMVMENGRIVEIDAPEKLMIDKSSRFYEFAQGSTS